MFNRFIVLILAACLLNQFPKQAIAQSTTNPIGGETALPGNNGGGNDNNGLPGGGGNGGGSGSNAGGGNDNNGLPGGGSNGGGSGSNAGGGNDNNGLPGGGGNGGGSGSNAGGGNDNNGGSGSNAGGGNDNNGGSGSNAGGEDDNNGGNDSSSASNESTDLKKDKRKAELKFKWQPVFYLDLDWGKRVTNMTLHNPRLDAPNSLVVDDYSGGLRLERYHLIEGGIGASGSWWYEGAENYKKHLTAFVGLIPILGSQMHSIQYVNTVKEVELVPEITAVPDQAAQLKTWAVGDSVNYLKSGGLIFFAGLAYSGYGPGVTAIAKGTWSVFVQKNSPNDVYVKITKGDLKSFSTTISGALVSVGVSTFKGADQGFSFLINTQSEIGQKAYEDLVRGNVGAVQKLALENKDVRYIDTQKVGTTANYFNFFFGLPILANATFSAGKLHTFSQTDLIIDNSKADVHYGVYVQDQRTKFFGTHTNNTASFAGAAYKITDSKGTSNGYFGQYVVNVGDESSTSGDVSRFVDEVIRKSGLNQQMSVMVPKGNFDYASANLEVIYSQVQTDRMMNVVTKMNKYQFANSYTQYVGDYFFKLGDPWKLCANSGVDYTQCVDKTKARTETALLEMWESLTKMKANINNPEAFAKAYGQFGKGATENALTFQVSLVLAGEGVELYYRIEGARFSLYELYFQTTKTPGSFKVVSKPGQPLPVSAPVTRADRNRGIIVAPNYPVYPPVNP